MMPDGPCRKLPQGFSETDLDEIVQGYSHVRETENEIRFTPPVTPTSNSTQFSIGNLVTTGDEHHIGHIKTIEKDNVLVRIFLGPGKPSMEKKYPLSAVKRHEIPQKTRVYIRSVNGDNWELGRITNSLPETLLTTYTVGRPGRPPVDLVESEIEITSRSVELNPADILASGAIDSQSIHEDRALVIKAIYDYRSQSRGLTGAMSASIDLLPHQIGAAHRIMTDSIQRYLLADEVGLGKTIEAGSVIRQILLDDPDEEIVVVVPIQLVPQWIRELRNKFHLQEFDGQWKVISFEQLPELENQQFSTLVVDEVHNLITPSLGDENIVKISGPLQLLMNCCARVDRLLLMSATPVISGDISTLVMLHLLDPISYPLDQTEQFEAKVISRQEIGRLLLSLQADSNPMLLRMALDRLKSLVPEDQVIQATAERIADVIKVGADADSLDIQIRSFRLYIANKYRIHQRVLRTRRKDLPASVILPQSHDVQSESLDQDISESVIDELLTWNEVMLTDNFAGIDPDLSSTLPLPQIKQFKTLFELVSCDSATMLQKLNSYNAIDDELESIRTATVSAAKTHPLPLKSASIVKNYLDELRNSGVTIPKLVAFTSTSNAAHLFAKALKPLVGSEATLLIVNEMNQDDIEEQITDFMESPEPSVLVCDQTGEEGLNLHFAHGIVHLDLPFSAARMQQRIGRLDRFGRRLQIIHHLVLLPTKSPGTPWIAWFELLKDGFKIFEQPISDIQFMLEEIQNRLEVILFFEGSSGLSREVKNVQERVRQERENIESQFALDLMVANTDHQDQPLFSDGFDKVFDEDAASQNIIRWATRRIGLTRRTVDGYDPASIFKLKLDSRVQIPRVIAYKHLAEGLETPLTSERDVAVANTNVKLVRPGSPIVDGIGDLIRVDERGSTFATWRSYPAMNLTDIGDTPVLRLTYSLETNRDLIVDALERESDGADLESIMRRADSYFPPFTGTLHIGLDLDPSSIPAALSNIVSGDFDLDGTNGEWIDRHLIGKEEITNSIVDPLTLSIACDRITKDLGSILKKSEGISERIENSVNHAKQLLAIEKNNLVQRRDSSTHNASSLDFELRINETIVAAISTPSVDLDSIGLIIVSGTIPRLSL